MKWFYVIIVTLISNPVWGQLQWESKASLPHQGVSNAISFNVAGKYYVGLGETYDGTYSKEIWEYDPATNVWTKKKNYPGSGSRHAVAMVIGTRVFVGMGGSASARHADFYEYNPANDSWTQRANFPGGGRYASSTFVIGDSGYVALGSCGGPSCYNDELWMYVPASNSWKQMANYPGGDGTQPATFAIGRYGYAGNELDPSKNLSNDFYRYDPSNNSWTKVATMPGTARKSTSAFVISGKAYVGFGTYGSPTTAYVNDMYMYDPSKNTWTHYTNNDDFTKREVVRIEALSDSMVFGGFGYGPNGCLTDFWQLKVDSVQCDYYDTTFVYSYDTIDVFDTTFTIIYDTTYTTVTVYDTLPVYDTILVYDTSIIVINDTFNVTIYDTTNVIVYDTTIVYHIDTITVYDTLRATIYDTILVYDTIIYNRYVTVGDTLRINLYDSSGCGENHIKLYPNPTKEYLNIFTHKWGCYRNGKVEIIDQWGQTVMEQDYNAQFISFDLRGLASSLYFVRLIDEDNKVVFVRKIIVQ